MRIRPYWPGDDAALLAIEYRSPRGASNPFVHYRHRFSDRVALFPESQLFVLEIDNKPAGCIAVALKHTQIALQPTTIGYIFDLRVDPEYRRHGLGTLLTRHAEAYAISKGAVATYGLVITVNQPSLKLLENQGYQRIRQVLYLEYPPTVMESPPIMPIDCDGADDMIRFTTTADRDFYVDDVGKNVSRYDYVRWFHDSNFGYASLSGFELSRVYRQVSPDDLALPHEVLKQRARCLRLFHPIGALESPELMNSVFATVLDEAMTNNYYSLSFVLDAEETLPGCFFQAADHQKRYWLVVHCLHPDFNPESWGSPFYIDPRDI